MLLPYGLKNGHLIHISEVERGVTDLRCPYCDAELLAKKGKVMTHHFAHRSASCWSSSGNDFFGLKGNLDTHQSLEEYAKKTRQNLHHNLEKLHQKLEKQQQQQTHIQTQIKKMWESLTQITPQNEAAQIAKTTTRTYLDNEFADFPNLTTIRHPSLFSYTDGTNKIQYHELNAQQHQHFYPSYYHYPLLALKQYHTNRQQILELEEKIKLYQKDRAWFEQFRLYFLEIKVSEQAIFHKIGLTSRPLEQRIVEVENALKKHFDTVQIKVLFELKNVAFLERFFKQKYRRYRYELAQFTEYFLLEEYELEVIQKLNNIQKVITIDKNRDMLNND
ncbi:MAG: GIY-YIG nuclease family protein [Bacteroidota bacterium]